jgi:hypothetical protein
VGRAIWKRRSGIPCDRESRTTLTDGLRSTYGYLEACLNQVPDLAGSVAVEKPRSGCEFINRRV